MRLIRWGCRVEDDCFGAVKLGKIAYDMRAAPATAAIAYVLPKVPQKGTAPSSAASSASNVMQRATSAACPAMVC